MGQSGPTMLDASPHGPMKVDQSQEGGLNLAHATATKSAPSQSWSTSFPNPLLPCSIHLCLLLTPYAFLTKPAGIHSCTQLVQSWCSCSFLSLSPSAHPTTDLLVPGVPGRPLLPGLCCHSVCGGGQAMLCVASYFATAIKHAELLEHEFKLHSKPIGFVHYSPATVLKMFFFSVSMCVCVRVFACDMSKHYHLFSAALATKTNTCNGK